MSQIYAILASMKNSFSPPKGILFDMDGVLLLTTQRSHQSWQQVCQQTARTLNLSPHLLETALYESLHSYHHALENDAKKQQRDRLEPFETRREVVEHALQRLGRNDGELASAMVRAYEALRDEHRQLAPQAIETLQALHKHIPLVLISNGNATYQRKKIKQYALAPYFSTILIEQEFGVAKPDPSIFRAALNALHITAEEAWMIGDDLAFDIAGSQRLGIRAIWCDYEHQGLPTVPPAVPDSIIYHIQEVCTLF